MSARSKRAGRRRARSIALALAEAKAVAVAPKCRAKLVLGSDSLVSVAGQRFDKPASREDAARICASFRARSCSCTARRRWCAMARCCGATASWRALHVAPLSESFIETYLDAEWPAVAGCVGVFRIEARGVQLFERDRGRSFHRAGHAAAGGAGRAARSGGTAAMTRAYAEVIGDPISHSKSPLIHGFWLEKLGIAADYRACHVPSQDLPAYLASRRADPHWRGCNVTIPHKALAIGAVNTVVPLPGGGLGGTNTDVDGVADAVGDLRLDGRHAVVIGAGGAARALAMLIGQAAAAFEKFFGQAAPREADAELRAILTR
jgi:predicted house-cleaning NTP pyrophosphatase (Maf/HAM1 superfamily)